jgi:hypothetical protein
MKNVHVRDLISAVQFDKEITVTEGSFDHAQPEEVSFIYSL